LNSRFEVYKAEIFNKSFSCSIIKKYSACILFFDKSKDLTNYFKRWFKKFLKKCLFVDNTFTDFAAGNGPNITATVRF
ncbi:MAG: hypothetical protein EAZ26_08535, partial [Runella slithyformis]